MPANLSSLMQVAPSTAAFFMGQDHASDQEQAAANTQNTLQDVLSKKQAYGFNEQNNPLLLEKQRLSNTGLGLDNENKGYDNTIKRDTMGSTIGSTNAKNALGITEAHIKQSQALEDRLADVAAGMSSGQIPGPLAGQAVAQALQSAGIDASHPAVQKWAQELAANPLALAAKLDDMKRHRIEMSEKYYEKAMEVREHNKGSAAVANINGATQRDVERMRIEAGKYNKKDVSVTVEQMLLKSRNAAQSAEILEQAYNLAQAAGDEEGMAKYAARAKQARQRAAEDANNRAMGQPGVDPAAVSGLQPKPRAAATAPIAGDGWNPNLPGNQPQGGVSPDIANFAKQNGLPLEPDKYDYRIVNGKLQKKAKQ